MCLHIVREESHARNHLKVIKVQKRFRHDESGHTHTHTYAQTHKTCSDDLFGWTCSISLLLCNVADVSAGLCLSPFVKSYGCWLHSTGKVQTASDVCCSLKWRNDLMTGPGWVGGGHTHRPGWEDVMDRIKSKHATKLALLNNGFQSVTSVHKVLL